MSFDTKTEQKITKLETENKNLRDRVNKLEEQMENLRIIFFNLKDDLEVHKNRSLTFVHKNDIS